jgi:hypothetical protein
VQELTTADESVVKKYKEAGEIVNSWVKHEINCDLRVEYKNLDAWNFLI